MRGSETRLLEYMDKRNQCFVIPVYQRNYDWKVENCRQLFDDLITVIRTNRQSHFFGSIVSSYQPNGRCSEFLVIDGQQRLTTVSLLLLAMYHLLSQEKIVSKTDALAQQIFEDYLVNKYQPRETRIKLKPVKNDREAFDKILENDGEYNRESNLTQNYLYFFERIQKEEVSVDELFDALMRLEIINIELTKDDNPQLIFESLNSTGVALSEGDKIRNFILMGLPIERQNDFYDRYWNKIEICTNYDVSMFMRDYLSIKQQVIPALNKVYTTFKAYVRDLTLESEGLLQELLSYAKWYAILLNGKTEDRVLNACIYRLNRLETTVTRPFFLEVLRLQAAGRITLTETREIFLYTENYLFRRSICDLPTNVLNKVFLFLHKEIIRFDGSDENYLEKFKYAVLSKSKRARFPGDAEFESAFSERQVYKMNSKNKIYILERFENYGTIEDKDIYRHCDENVYSVEHIMPQHLTPNWIKTLGDDYEQIHALWLHRIANLTLTGYNSKYSNNAFVDKRDMANGFDESGLRLNSWIARQKTWGLSELEERNQMLMNRALDIWSRPESAYEIPEKQLDSYTLADDVDLSGRDMTRFEYKNTEQPVASWADMLEKVLKILHAEDATVLSKLAFSSDRNNELSTLICHDASMLRGVLKIDADIFVEKNTSTMAKLSMLRKLFKEYGADPEDLTFYLKDDKSLQDEDTGTRNEWRLEYWRFALPYIQEAHGPTRSFNNRNPTTCSWINGFIGINGFSLCCVANREGARVEMLLNKPDREINKEAFDYLKEHQADIEVALDAHLEWRRKEEAKSSQLVIRLPNVSIDQKSDWLQMAKFHAAWSRKFFDVIVPYLKQRY